MVLVFLRRPEAIEPLMLSPVSGIHYDAELIHVSFNKSSSTCLLFLSVAYRFSCFWNSYFFNKGSSMFFFLSVICTWILLGVWVPEGFYVLLFAMSYPNDSPESMLKGV